MPPPHRERPFRIYRHPAGDADYPGNGHGSGGQNVVGGATPGAVALGPLGAPITPDGTVPGGQNVVGGPNAAEIALAPLGPPITTGMGTTPGGQSVLGVTYAMGAGGMALNLTVRSAEYTPGHVIAKPGSDRRRMTRSCWWSTTRWGIRPQRP